MNEGLFVAACFAGAALVWLLAVYIEAHDAREAAAMRDALDPYAEPDQAEQPDGFGDLP